VEVQSIIPKEYVKAEVAQVLIALTTFLPDSLLLRVKVSFLV